MSKDKGILSTPLGEMTVAGIAGSLFSGLIIFAVFALLVLTLLAPVFGSMFFMFWFKCYHGDGMVVNPYSCSWPPSMMVGDKVVRRNYLIVNFLASVTGVLGFVWLVCYVIPALWGMWVG